MPQMGESITEGTVSKWLKAVGDKIEKDEALLEISTDKVDAEVPSPAAGTLLAINVQEGETVEVGSVLALVGAEGGSTARSSPTAAGTGSRSADPRRSSDTNAGARSSAASSNGGSRRQRPTAVTNGGRDGRRASPDQDRARSSATSPTNTASTLHAFRAAASAAA